MGSGGGKANRVIVCPVSITFKDPTQGKAPLLGQKCGPGSQAPTSRSWGSVGGSARLRRLQRVGGVGQWHCCFLEVWTSDILGVL